MVHVAIYEGIQMLDVLYKAKGELKKLLADEEGWNTVFINYHPPFVERL